jgi:hypothetical protein
MVSGRGRQRFMAYLTDSTCCTSVVENNPRKIIRYSSDCPKLIARNAVVKKRETESAWSRSISDLIVTLVGKRYVRYVKEGSHQSIVTEKVKKKLTLHHTFLPSIVSTRKTGSYHISFLLTLS